MTTFIHLIRHGETFFNKDHRLAGRIETPLTPLGIHQAQKLGQQLAANATAYDVIVCSPLGRAYQTAVCISQWLKRPVEKFSGLEEISFGEYEGISLDRLKDIKYDQPLQFKNISVSDGAELRKYYKLLNPEFDDVRHPGGESKAEARQRFLAALRSYILTHPQYHHICVVCHNTVIRLALAGISGSSEIEEIGNATAITIAYDEDKRFFIPEN